jgi:primosomal protein N'
MYIVTVVPFSRGIQKEELTYFTGKPVLAGDIVTVPLRKKNIEALVTKVEDLATSKSEVKEKTFNLKKVTSIKGKSFFPPQFFKAAEKVAPYFVSSQGAIAEAMLPKLFFDKYDELKAVIKTPPIEPIREENEEEETTTAAEKLVYQAPQEDRAGYYRTYIREAFAKKQSVFMMLPNGSDISFWKKSIEKGIEKYVYTFDGSMPIKDLVASITRMNAEDHAIIILGTPSFLALPRHDLKTIIVEHERSDGYKLQARPYVDSRIFAEMYASLGGQRIILADTFVRTELMLRKKNFEMSEVSPLMFSMNAREKAMVIDMKAEDKIMEKKVFRVLSQKTERMIERALRDKEHVFLFTLRKGLAPTTVCNDCKSQLLCKECSAPLALYTKNTTARIFICPRCKNEEDSITKCPTCYSWNLTPLGIGTERVYEETRNRFPEADIILIDKDTTKTRVQVNKAIKTFLETPGAILIGTELALMYLKEKISYSAVISLDTLFSIPSFEISEKIVGLLAELLEKTEKHMFIQTRNADEKILNYLTHNTLSLFYKEELAERQTFDYPPYTRLIKVKAPPGSRGKQVKDELESLFADYAPYFVSSYSPKTKTKSYAMIIKVPRESWSIPALSRTCQILPSLHEKLASLPPSYAVEVSPQSLFA